MNLRVTRSRERAVLVIQEATRNLLTGLANRTVTIHPVSLPAIMTSFILNPYDQLLDISKKDHLKLYTDGCKGLEKDLRFDGKRENYDKFVKLFGKRMSDTRVKECLLISTEWEKSGTDPEFPVADKVIDLFKSSAVSKEDVKFHCDIVWDLSLIHI